MVPKVLEAARWASFDEDSVWHERVGSALLEYGSEERAIKEFETAKSLDEKNWRADLGMARALAEQPGKRPRAIKMMERTLEILEADEIWMAQNEKDFSKWVFELAEWYSGNGELEKAAKEYRRVWGLSPNDPTKPAATSLIKILFRLQKYNEITDFLRQMAEEMPYDAEVDRLTEFYHVTAMEMEFYDHIGTSGRKSGALDFLRESYRKAIKEADRKSLTITSDYLLYHYGILLLRDYGEVSQATRIFEAVLSMTAATADRDLVFYLRQDAKIRLGTIYREQAKLAGVGSPTARANIDKLTQLSGRGNESEDDVDSDAPQSGDCIQILGQWLKQEENDDAGARKIFRRRVKLAIDWLSDTDPYNDADAYEILAFALTYYGDYDNASAAFSLLGPVEPELEEVENESSKGSGDDTTLEDRDVAEANANVGGVAVQDIIGDCEDKPKEDESKPKEEGVDLPIATVNLHRETTNDVCKSREQNPDAEPIKPQTEPNEDEDGHVESTQPINTNGVEVGTDDKDAPEAETTDPNHALADSEAEAKWLCDGLCGRTWPVLQDVWICTTCLATGFCSTCVAEVRNKTIGFRVCDPQHMFLETPKATELLPRGKVRFRGELVGIEEWKGWIAEAWGL